MTLNIQSTLLIGPFANPLPQRLEITYIYPWVHIPPYLHGSMAMYKYQVIQTMQQILHEGLQEGLALRLEIHLV